MAWQQWNAATPVIPGLAGIVNPAPAVNPAGILPPGAQYSPEQWAQMQQQNWQQWAQWQQQYQQWHQQYGAEYQKSMTALSQQAALQAPLLNTSVPPPLPPEVKPPQPPDDSALEDRNFGVSSQPNFSAPPPLFQSNNQNKNNQPQNHPPLNQQSPFGYNRTNTQNNRNFSASYQQGKNNQTRPPSLMSLSIKKPDFSQETEPKRMKMDGATTKTDAPLSIDKMDAKIDVDTQSNASLLATEDLSETEKKFIKQFTEWEAQFNKWKEQNVNHPDKEQYREYEKKWEAWRTQLLERREQMRRKRLGLLENQKAQIAIQPKMDNLNKSSVCFENPVPDVKDDGTSFLKLSSSDGIPGLDLVEDAPDEERLPPKSSPVIELDKSPDMLKKVGPDLEAISKGINSILGDQKLLSMLSMVSQNQKIQPASNVTDTTSRIHDTRGFEKEFAETSSQGGWSSHGDQRNFDNMSNYDDHSRSSFGGKPDQQDWNNRDYNNYGNSNYSKGPIFRGRNQENYRDPDNFQASDSHKSSGTLNFEPPDSFRGPGQDKFRGPDNFRGSDNFRGADNFRGPDNPIRGTDNFRSSDKFCGPSTFQASNTFKGQDSIQSSDNARGQINFRASNSFSSGDPDNSGNFKASDNFRGPDNLRGSRSFGGTDNFRGGDSFNDPSNLRRGNTFQGKDNFRGPDGFGQSAFGDEEEFEGQDSYRRSGNFQGDNFQGSNYQGGQRFEPSSTYQDRGDFRRSNFQNQFDDRMGQGDEYQEENYDNYDEGQGEYQDQFSDNYGIGASSRNFDSRFESNRYNENYEENYEQENYDSVPTREAAQKDVPTESRSNVPVAENNIWQPVNVIEYEHKSQKPDDIRVSVEPLRTFDYRHKPVNRIPLPQRPDWLKKTLRNCREFDFVINRYDQTSYSRYPSDRYDRYSDGSRYPDRNRRSDEYRPGSRRGMDDVPPRDYDARQMSPPRGKYDESQRGKHEDPKRGRYEEPQRIKFEESQREKHDDQPRGKYEEPPKGRYEESSLRGRYEEPERLKYEESQRGRFEEPQRGRFEEPARGRYDEVARGRFEEPQRGRFDQPPRGRLDEPQKGRFEESHRGRFEEKKTVFDRDDFNKEMRHKDGSNRDIKMSPPHTFSAKTTTLIEDILNPPGRFSRPARIVIILRGPPGSGKTFLAKLIKDKEVENGGSAPRILSLDDYFMVEQEKEVEEDGKKSKIKVMEYEYDGTMEAVYRVSLFKAFKKTVTDGYFTFIIVDNINDKVKYFGEMWSFAKQNGFQVYVCQLEFDLATCTKRNIHNRSEVEIQTIISGWDVTPSHHPTLDATSLVQSASIPEVEMEEINSPPSDDFDDDCAEEKACGSKWDHFDCSLGNLAKLDGTSKPLRASKTMEDYLQIDDDWVARESKPGQKRVRWADLEERKQQQKMRAIGFVVGQTNWDRMMDPTMGSSALTQTKYIERVPRFYRD